MSYLNNCKFKTVFLGDEEFFEFPTTNSKITRKFCNKNKGTIPVYASSKNEHENLGTIQDNLDGVYYYEDCISWNRNGSVGYVFVRDHKFATNEDHRVILIKDKYKKSLSKEYLKYAIERKLLISGFSYLNKCGVDKIKSVSIEIPVSERDVFDVELQKEIANQHRKILEFKEKVQEIQQEIKNKRVNLEEEYVYVEKPLKELFTIKQGNSYYTKKRILTNGWMGNIPVYSSNTKNNGLLISMREDEVLEHDLYYQHCLTWSVDGYAGQLFERNGENTQNKKNKKYFFMINNHCGILDPLDTDLYLSFFKHLLQPLFFDMSKGYKNKKLGSNQIENIQVRIPIDKNGKYDYEKQKEIATMYEIIEKTKQEFIEYVDTIKSSKVVLVDT